MADQNHLVYDASDNMDFFIANFNHANHEFINASSQDMYNVIHNYIEKNSIDILAIMNKKHSFLKRFFITDEVERFAFKIDIPLLVMQYH